MSQALTPGLLSEDEIRSYINESYNLKLDRDAFLKPQKELIMEIYTIFLDDFELKWRKPRNTSGTLFEPNLKAQMVGWLRKIFSQYNTPYEFSMSDLLQPTRKRTVAFFNVLIFVKAQLDERWSKWQNLKREWDATQKEVDEIDHQLAQRKLQIEDLAIRKANLPTVEELRRVLAAKREKFEVSSKRCEVLCEEANKVKQSIKEVQDRIKKKLDDGDQEEKEVAELKATLTMLNEGRDIKKKLAAMEASLQDEMTRLERCREADQKLAEDVERKKALANIGDMIQADTYLEDHTRIFNSLQTERVAIQNRLEQARGVQTRLHVEENELQKRISLVEVNRRKQKLKHQVKVEQEKAQIEKENNQARELEHLFERKVEQLRGEIESVRKDTASLVSRAALQSQNYQSDIDRVTRQADMLVKKYEESVPKAQESLSRWTNINAELDRLFGRAREPNGIVANLSLAPSAVNSTFSQGPGITSHPTTIDKEHTAPPQANVTYTSGQANSTYTVPKANATFIKETDRF